METDELKNIWGELENKLNENKSLNESIYKEMIHSKANKSLNKLTNHQIFVTVICFIVTPLPFMLLKENRLTIIQEVLSYVFMGFLLYGIISNIRKLYTLLQIDFSKSLKENIRYLLTYNIGVKRDKNMAFFFIYPLLFVFFAETVRVSSGSSPFAQSAFYMGVLAFGLFMGYWQYRKIYVANIDSIKKSLDELQDFED